MEKLRSASKIRLPKKIITLRRGPHLAEAASLLREAQEAARTSQGYFEQLFTQSTDAIAACDANEYVLDVNPAFIDFFGYTPEEARGKHINDLVVPPDLVTGAVAIANRVAKGERSYLEALRQHKDGHLIPVTVTGAPVMIAGKRVGVYAIYRDMTEQKQAEAALAKSEERYALAMRGANDGLWDWNIVTGEKYYTPRFKELLGYHDATITNAELQKKFPTLLVPGEWKRMEAATKAHLKHGAPYDLEYEIILDSGDRRWFRSRAHAIWDEKTGKPLRMVGSFRDITRRRLAEEQLAASQKLLQDVLAGSPVATYVIDLNHKIIIWNKAMEHLAGRKAHQMIGTDRHWEVFYPEKRPMIVDYMVKGLATSQIIRRHYRHTNFSESRFENGVVGDVFFSGFYKGGKWLRFMIKPLYDFEGRRIGAIEMMEDVHQQKLDHERIHHFNEELKVTVAEKTRHLEEANKHLQSLNVLKDEFIAVTSHELRSPLTAARGYLSFLNDPETRATLPENARQYVSRAYNNVEALNSLVNNILDVSRLESGRFTLRKIQTNLVSLVQNLLDNLSISAREKKLAVRFKNLTGSPQLMLPLDPLRLHQVVVNLLDNAIKYSKPGKSIWVILRIRDSRVQLVIKDQGIGIPQREVSKIFDKFIQAKNAASRYQGGAGLGLFITQKIVELHGGTIAVQSRLHLGTTFTLSLPLK